MLSGFIFILKWKTVDTYVSFKIWLLVWRTPCLHLSSISSIPSTSQPIRKDSATAWHLSVPARKYKALDGATEKNVARSNKQWVSFGAAHQVCLSLSLCISEWVSSTHLNPLSLKFSDVQHALIDLALLDSGDLIDTELLGVVKPDPDEGGIPSQGWPLQGTIWIATTSTYYRKT